MPTTTSVKPTFYHCGICEHWHPINWDGDCRDDASRFSTSDLEDRYGQQDDGWLEAPMPGGEESHPELLTTLADKLHPRRFSAMSGKMAAITAYLLGTSWTSPTLSELVVTSDGYLLGRQQGDYGCNEFLGTESDLLSNWTYLLSVADLTPGELDLAQTLYRLRVRHP